ncbi:MAG: DinB family protein [Lutibacter sp.]|nr:DinB family protein [Lutibacter sp.]
MHWLSESYLVEGDFVKSEKINPIGKTEILKDLRIEFDKVSEIVKMVSLEDLSTEVAFFSGPKSKLQILNLLQDHVTHHRGQLVIYLNLNGVVPPKYIGW